jgi:hypothetical protein
VYFYPKQSNRTIRVDGVLTVFSQKNC